MGEMTKEKLQAIEAGHFGEVTGERLETKDKLILQILAYMALWIESRGNDG